MKWATHCFKRELFHLLWNLLTDNGQYVNTNYQSVNCGRKKFWCKMSKKAKRKTQVDPSFILMLNSFCSSNHRRERRSVCWAAVATHCLMLDGCWRHLPPCFFISDGQTLAQHNHSSWCLLTTFVWAVLTASCPSCLIRLVLFPGIPCFVPEWVSSVSELNLILI